MKITNGSMTLEVTAGAYKSIFAAQGWAKCGEKVETAPQKKPEKTPETATETAAEIEPQTEPEEPADVSEIPLEQMTLEQLRKYADALGVDYTPGARQKTIRNAIRYFLEKH